jgi:hypothetical protein
MSCSSRARDANAKTEKTERDQTSVVVVVTMQEFLLLATHETQSQSPEPFQFRPISARSVKEGGAPTRSQLRTQGPRVNIRKFGFL